MLELGMHLPAMACWRRCSGQHGPSMKVKSWGQQTAARRGNCIERVSGPEGQLSRSSLSRQNRWPHRPLGRLTLLSASMGPVYAEWLARGRGVLLTRVRVRVRCMRPFACQAEGKPCQCPELPASSSSWVPGPWTFLPTNSQELQWSGV